MKALKIIASAAAAVIFSTVITTGVFAHQGEASHKKTSGCNKHISCTYTVNPQNKSEEEGLADWHHVPDEDGNISDDCPRCSNTYRGLKFIKNISSYTVDEKGEDGVIRPVEYRINRYGLYCTSCEIHSGCQVFIDEATLVVKKEDEEALAQGKLLKFGNYSPEEIDSFRPKEGHIGDCDCSTYNIAELCVPTGVEYSRHESTDGKTCYVTATTRSHEMFCTDCGGYIGSYEKECEIAHSNCGKHYDNCVKN